MKYFSRPYKIIGAAVLLMAGWLAAPPGALAQTTISKLMQEINPLLSRTQGYLGVMVSDVDNDTASKYKLKEVRGAIITLIDHDAPAGQIGLHVNDVVISVNGQTVEGADQFGRMMREIPAGHKATLVISRDGAQQNITVQLVDRKKMEHDAWNKVNSPDNFPPPPSGMGYLSGVGDIWTSHVSPFGSSLNVGAMVEPLTAQMADYLGVQNGIMIKQVTRKSEAAHAGLKPHDVVLKVGNENIQTAADWDRALRSNEGKQVQVTILREGKQQVVNLQVDSKHHSLNQWTDIFPQSDCPEMAALDLELNQEQINQDLSGLADALRQQAQDLHSEITDQQAQGLRSEITDQQAQDLEQQAQKLRDSLKAGVFPELKVDPKAVEELRKQMEQFGQSFNPDQFKIDQKQMEELQRQMEELRKTFPQDFQFDRRQLDKLQRELKDIRDWSLRQPA